MTEAITSGAAVIVMLAVFVYLELYLYLRGHDRHIGRQRREDDNRVGRNYARQHDNGPRWRP